MAGFAALIAATVAGPVHAGSVTGTLKTIVLGPVAMVNVTPLDFGGIIPTGGGTVTVDAQTGTRTSAGVVLAGGTVSNARFVATGTPDQVVSLSLNPSPIIIVNGASNMSVNQLRVSINGGGPQPLGPNANLGPLGIINYAIGGRLTVSGTQADGLYTGTFTLTMDYQ